jgi:hypothetical protein
MGTFTAHFKRTNAMAASADRVGKVRAESDPFRLRALPNDDVFLYLKMVDNSRIVRAADPRESGHAWSVMSAAAVLLVIGASVVTPKAITILDGYKLEKLKVDNQSLIDRKRELAAREASLLSPERLNEAAKAQRLTSPASSQIFHLDNPPAEGHFAKVEGPRSGAPTQQ